MFWHSGVGLSPTLLVSGSKKCRQDDSGSTPQLQSVQAGQNEWQRVVVIVVVDYPHRWTSFMKCRMYVDVMPARFLQRRCNYRVIVVVVVRLWV